MRIVVTGGSGRLGSDVVRQLCGSGHEVLTLDLARPRRELLASETFLLTDLSRRDILDPRLAEFAPDAIAHLGELPDARVDREERVYTRNAAATATLLMTAAELGVGRLVYVSSCQVYGQFGVHSERQPIPPVKLPIDEDEPLRPWTGYGAQKVGAEALLASLTLRQSLHGVSLRPPGTSSIDRYVRQIRWELSSGRYHGHLREVGAWLDSKDFAAAVEATLCWQGDRPPWAGAAREGQSAGTHVAFNVASDEPMFIGRPADFAKAMREHHPSYPPIPEPDEGEQLVAPYCSRRLREATGWRSRTGIAELFEAADVDRSDIAKALRRG